MLDRRSFLSHSIAAGLIGSRVPELLAAPAKLEADAKPGPIIETATGKVRGFEKPGVSTFRGIPYGASTAGDRRFMPAIKPAPWTGVRDAMEFGLKSPQGPSGLRPEADAEDRHEPMGEDCLMLNVWTGSTKGKRPVMLWLHGGGYAGGSAAYTIYDGTELARKHDVVVVGINHRLNAFGYLFLADVGGPKYAESVNIGMMDIVFALQWVKDNIANFGGDPSNVTIFGQSGGGGKVSTLLAMPPAHGLFHKAVVESGSTMKQTPRDAANKSTDAYLAKLGLKADPSGVDELQKMPMEQLLGAIRGVQGLRLAPVVDGKTLPTDPFDPGAPAISANIPMIIGCNAEEGPFGANAKLEPIDDATLHARTKEAIHCDDAAADRLVALYRKSNPGAANLDLYWKLTSDAAVRTNAMTQAERKAAQKAPVYMYNFAWNSPVEGGKLKSMHTMEIPFVFDQIGGAKAMTGDGPEANALATKVSGAWAAFAHTGDPSHKGIPKWPAFEGSKRATMIFDNDCKVKDDPNHEERLVLAEIRGSQA